MTSTNLACPKCHYDLRGLTEPRCPECGQDLAITTPRGEAGLAFVACRIVALLLAVRAVVPFANGVFSILAAIFWRDSPPGVALQVAGIYLVSVIVMILPAALLWFAAGPIASRMLRHAETRSSMTFDAALLTDVAFKIIGVLLIVDAVPWTSTLIALTWSGQGVFTQSTFKEYVPPLLGSAIKVALGLWLVLGTHGILRLIDRIRTAGIEKPST